MWITTNYDDVLEKAWTGPDSQEVLDTWPAVRRLREAQREHRHLPKLHCFGNHQTTQIADYLLRRDPFILQAHGSMMDWEHLVLTSRQYQQLLYSRPAFWDLFQAILLTHSILFVGCSLRDPNFQYMLGRHFVRFEHRATARWALLDNVSTHEARVLREIHGIQAIHYPRDKHDCLRRFLAGIALHGQVRQDELRVDTRSVPAGRTPIVAA